ncbi:MAG: TonB C-terminal domain-containing protein, partial [Victivallales bacterium]|nr:TonB C-terminal domain-containing protein [Victivallales bacterium]
PEVQEPEPPKPEPPKPEPPKPEPPKPEPPKPEPPKPEPPKPEPPKPEPPKPEPPKPEPPKPKVKSIAERLKEAPIKNASPNVQKQAEQPPVKVVSQQELIKRLADAGKLPSTPKTNLTQPLRLAPKVQEESVNYAENVVKPGYYEAWETPRVGDRHPTPVVVELDVISDGRVVSAKITRRSNDALMNASVEKLIQTVRQFVPFAQAGIKSSSLHIIVTMEIVD